MKNTIFLSTALILAALLFSACSIGVKGGAPVQDPPVAPQAALKADSVLRVGADSELINKIEFSSALPQGATHTWTWTATSDGVLHLNPSSVVWMGCANTPFKDEVSIQEEGASEKKLSLPAALDVLKGRNYSIRIEVQANECMGGNYSIAANLVSKKTTSTKQISDLKAVFAEESAQ